MKVALVYDRVSKWGGAERVLLALHKIWPDAPLFTAIFDAKKAPWSSEFRVKSSFLSRLPWATGAHEWLAIATPIAFESFTFDEYDVVISVTSAEAKYILTKPGTVHICYCLTPTRYLWSGLALYQQHPGLGVLNRLASWGLARLSPLLKRWDLVGASRPDYYIAISQLVKKRIEKYYHRQVEGVLYPPVIAYPKNTRESKGYFLVVSRLVGYKRLDLVIDAFNQMGLPLVIIGDGHQKNELVRRAKKNITFIDRYLTDSELVRYYEECRAFVFAAQEDFGISAAEAQMAGKPVIGYKNSGVAEIIKDGKTGILFETQTKESIIDSVKKFDTISFSALDCRRQGELVSETVFASQMAALVNQIVKKHTI